MTTVAAFSDPRTSAHWVTVAAELQERATQTDALLRELERQRRPYVLAAKTGTHQAQAVLDALAERQREIERERDDLRAAAQEAEREQHAAERREAEAVRLRRITEAREIIHARQLLAGALDEHLHDLARTYAALYATSQALAEYEDVTGRDWSSLHRVSLIGNALATVDPALARFINVHFTDSKGMSAASYEAELWGSFLSRTAEG